MKAADIPAMTVRQVIEMLEKFEDHQDQKLVFSDVKYGDFDLIGSVGSYLSEDNFQQDHRPILRLRKRK